MTQPVQEPTIDRAVAGVEYRARQLARRPALVPNSASTANLHIKVCADDEIVVPGDGQFIEAIAENMDNMFLVNVEIFVTTPSSSGIVRVQIRNRTTSVDMLSTRVQVDQGELNSQDAATTYVINPAFALVGWTHEICIDVDDAGVGAMGLGVHLEFSGIEPE